jgi:hypothetical protein
MQALKTGAQPKKKVKKPVTKQESSDDESDTEGSAGEDTSETDTETDTDGEWPKMKRVLSAFKRYGRSVTIENIRAFSVLRRAWHGVSGILQSVGPHLVDIRAAYINGWRKAEQFDMALGRL